MIAVKAKTGMFTFQF